jgi:competence ComEA-like helix-hairpin-helix protein
MKHLRRNAPGRGMLLIAAAVLLVCLNGKVRQAPPVSPEYFNDYGRSHPEPVDLNTADYWQLRCLPGINDDKARAILQYRSASGCFQSREDLLRVEGITEEILASVWFQIVLDADR